MRVLLFGSPGAGKGTQAHMLVHTHGLYHLSTGDMLRAARKARTDIGEKAKSYLAQGRLVPDVLVWKICKDRLDEIGGDRFVLDGYPRTVQQAQWLDAYLEDTVGPPVVISLEVDPNIIVGRLSQRRINRETGESYHLIFQPPPIDVPLEHIIQRKDDRPEAIINRLRIYEEQTRPVKEHYRDLGWLIEIDGVGTIDEVHNRINAALPQVTAPSPERAS